MIHKLNKCTHKGIMLSHYNYCYFMRFYRLFNWDSPVYSSVKGRARRSMHKIPLQDDWHYLGLLYNCSISVSVFQQTFILCSEVITTSKCIQSNG